MHPVEGTLTLNGQPLANAQVVFHPKSPVDKKIVAARGRTDASGNFKLTTYDAHDGAAEGAYAVTVQFYQTVSAQHGVPAWPQHPAPKYSLPTTTDVTAQNLLRRQQVNAAEYSLVNSCSSRREALILPHPEYRGEGTITMQGIP